MSPGPARAGEVVLTTERMVLRRFTPADADLLVELDSDPAVMHFITGGRPTPRSEVVDEVLPCWLGHYEKYSGYGFFAAQDRSDGEFLGWFHLRPGHGAGPDEPELGYRLRRSAWGRGLATEGSRALVDAAFAEHGARRVSAETMVVNTASRRVMEKAGLVLVRTFWQPWPDRIEGDEQGDVEYEVRRTDWAARRHPGAQE